MSDSRLKQLASGLGVFLRQELHCRFLFAVWRWPRWLWGIGAMILAAVLVGGWIRTHYQSDLVTVPVAPPWCLNLVSERGHFGIKAMRGDTPSTSSIKRIRGGGMHWFLRKPDSSEPYDPMKNVREPIKIEVFGFYAACSGANLFPLNYFAICIISYPLAATVLALIATWLLLSRKVQAD